MFLLQKQRKGWFVRQQIGGSWIAQIILVVVNISVDYKSHKGQGKISPDQRRDLLSGNMFSGLFYPILFELSALIPDPTFSKGLLDAFALYLLLFLVLEH